MRWLAILPCLFLLSPATGQQREGDGSLPADNVPALRGSTRVTGDELRREIVGNTLTGRIIAGGREYFSEFHAPDGRIFGHNNDDPVKDGCWVVRNDEVCFSYGAGLITGVFCWEYYRAPNGYTLRSTRSGSIGTARLESGNPYKWDDRGRQWSCDALLSWSRNYSPRDMTRLAASRAGSAMPR